MVQPISSNICLTKTILRSKRANKLMTSFKQWDLLKDRIDSTWFCISIIQLQFQCMVIYFFWFHKIICYSLRSISDQIHLFHLYVQVNFEHLKLKVDRMRWWILRFFWATLDFILVTRKRFRSSSLYKHRTDYWMKKSHKLTKNFYHL